MPRYGRGRFGFPEYVPVATRRRRAVEQATKAARAGVPLSPVEITGRKIAHTFWGQAWCTFIERHHDYESRLPRGRSYVRNGSVIDLQIFAGRITGQVMGSRLYHQEVTVQPCTAAERRQLGRICSEELGSVVDLLAGRLSDRVMKALTQSAHGLLAPSLSGFKCDCPDWSSLCKHLAALLYGVGARLDTDPALLFTLRGLDPADLVSATSIKGLDEEHASPELAGPLAEVFDIELAEAPPAAPAAPRPEPKQNARKRPARKTRSEPAVPVVKRPARKASQKPQRKAPKHPAPRTAPKRAPRRVARPRPSAVSTLTRRDLLDLGVPPGTIATWRQDFLLLPTASRGVYRLTAEVEERLKAYGF